ncbi:MAG: AarF/ABC1/UbiB kinase family protein [Myxococcales bacterium]|nr:AarF/ABC1/UbiB kinase family protein [Myxococcales bacterium]MCB9732701.1 AarF/ABC1/UbiB kinase family protein [Deltaproteobacteria bacterium]
MSDTKVGSSRLGRLTRLGWLGGRALPTAWKQLKGVVDAPEGGRGRAAERFAKKHADLADKAFRTLGDMKGVALKVGQMISYMDGVVPPELSGLYQDVLSRLQHAAPALRWSAIRPVLEAEIGPVERTFASFEEAPFAAASIGQVHRAVLRDGAAVAVKIQYPGVDRAMRSDLKNAELFQTMATPFMSVIGAGKATRKYMREVMAEVQARLLEELDYEREAAMQERFRALLAGDAEVRVPRVFTASSSRKVLVSELIVGRSLQDVADADDQAARDRYGRILTRTLLHCLHVLGLFNADPHPGNYLFPGDGSVCLLDFGCVKEIPGWMRDDMERNLRLALAATRSGADADWTAFDRQLGRALRLDALDPQLFRIYREFYLYVLRPALTEGPFDFTSAYTRESFDRVFEAVRDQVFGKGVMPRVPEVPPIPPDYTFLNRVQWGFYSILAILRAQVDWHALLPATLRDGLPEAAPAR